MTDQWTAPLVTLVDEPQLGDELTMLAGRLERNRTNLLQRCGGLTGEQLAQRSVPPSNLSLLGLIRHISDAERAWFRTRFAGESVSWIYKRDDTPDASFDEADPAAAEADYNALVAEWEACRKAAATGSLDDTFVHVRFGEMSLRWVYGHMIEEYARHCGHADFLRERIDGYTGD
ncbi:MAG TPA: DinB family protein [Pseudonocardiaceae bacterium]|nr:DinB family protein [Pseudonocardiaceae bacterium]